MLRFDLTWLTWLSSENGHTTRHFAKSSTDNAVSIMSAGGVPVEEIARVAGHKQTSTTELVYRRELRPVITTGAEL